MRKIIRAILAYQHRVQCPKCGTWWPTDQEASACFSSHY